MGWRRRGRATTATPASAALAWRPDGQAAEGSGQHRSGRRPLRETVGPPLGQRTVRADSGFYTHDVVAVCRKTKVRFSITVRLHQSLRNIIEAMPEANRMEGAADVAETRHPLRQ